MSVRRDLQSAPIWSSGKIDMTDAKDRPPAVGAYWIKEEDYPTLLNRAVTAVPDQSASDRHPAPGAVQASTHGSAATSESDSTLTKVEFFTMMQGIVRVQ